MSQSTLLIAISVIAILILLPLVVMVAVRYLIPLDDEVEPEQFEPAPQMNTLRDYWEGAMPHLIELRDRLFKAFGAIILGAVVGFWLVSDYSPIGSLPILIINHFAPGRTLEAIAVAEVFINYMAIALLVGIALAMPVVVYQIVAFFVPGLTGREKRIVFTALPFVTELFLAGLAFGWFFTVPQALNFLLNFGIENPEIDIKPTLDNFFSIVTRLLLWNGAVFELPAIVYLLARLGVVNTKQLSATRRYAIVVIVIVAAIITPTGDPYNLLLLAIPMYLLYELGILLSRFVPSSVKNRNAAANSKQPA
jgi:sec-independent protein translocase protein TatC